jgi:hypothetical protein
VPIRQFDNLKMRYLYFLFLTLLLISGCHNPRSTNSDATSSVVQADTTKHYGGLRDSVTDTRLKGLVNSDSVELLAVKHVVLNSNKIEQILYIDHSTDRSDRFLMLDSMFGYIASAIPDGHSILLNPIPAMNDRYIQVFSFRGKYVTTVVGDVKWSEEMLITDSAIIWIPDGLNVLLYKKGKRTGDRVRYVVSDEKKHLDTIQIKMLGGELGMQLWKWRDHGDAGYYLMVPQSKIGLIPALWAVNNVGLDGNMDVQFDHINYDSLFTAR